MNTSCIKSIKASYKVKSGSKSRMRGMIEYQEAQKEEKKEARREASRAEATSGSGAEATEEHPIRRTRYVVPKRPRTFASQGEPSPKKARKGSEATVSAQIPEIIPPGTEEQEEEKKKRSQSWLFVPEVYTTEALKYWWRESLHHGRRRCGCIMA